MPGKSIKQMVQEMATQQMPAITIGIVESIEPLTIRLYNDQNVSLSAVSLIIPTRMQNFYEGETVYMLSVNRGRSYYVLDEVANEEVLNEAENEEELDEG